MARIRTIKPQFFLNDELAELPAMVRLLFIGLWTQADRAGRLYDRPKRLKAELFPYESYDVEKGLKQLSDAGFIVRYKAVANLSVEDNSPRAGHKEEALIEIVNFLKHQQPHVKESESTLPAPCKNGSCTTGKEGNGIGKEGNGDAHGAMEDGDSSKEEKPPEQPPKKEKPPHSAPPPKSFSYCVMPWESDAFKEAWDMWKAYKKEQHKFVYKGNHSEQAALIGLSEKADGKEETAIAIIRQSMANGWSGLFTLKVENSNGQAGANNGVKSGGPNDGYKRKLAASMGLTPGGG